MPVIVIQPDPTDGKDTYLRSDAPTSNQGTDVFVFTGHQADPATYRIALQFDLTSIPAGSTINSAVLSFYIRNVAAGNNTIEAFRLKRAWTELGATWNKYDGTNDWGTAGADNTTSDREATGIGSVAVTTGDSQHTEKQISLTAASIQEMIPSGVFTNNGFLIKETVETGTTTTGYYSSDELTFTSERPKLTIDYTPPFTTSTTTSTTTTSTSTTTTSTSSSTTTTSTSTSITTSTSSSTTTTSTSTTTTSTSTTTTSTSTSITTSTSSSTTTTDALVFSVEDIEYSFKVDHPGE